MSVRVMSLVWATDLPTIDRFVALALADHAADDGTRVFPSIAALASKVGLGTTATRRAVRRLEASGVLVKVREGGGRSNTSEYRFDVVVLNNATRDVAFSGEINPTPDDAKPNASDTVSALNPTPGDVNPTPMRRGTIRTVKDLTTKEPSLREIDAPTSITSRRATDDVYEALFVLETGQPYSREARAEMPQTAAKLLAAKTAEINATGISADDLVAAIRAWPLVMGDATCTASAVAKHLPRLRAAANGVIARGQQPDQRQHLQAALEQLRRQEGEG